jgi:hypothetical protein
VTGLRNGEGFAFDDAGRLFATQHGRDQLFQNWPRFYTAAQSAELPAEELIQLIAGADIFDVRREPFLNSGRSACCER